MSTGSVQTVLVCVSSQIQQAPCPTGTAPVPMQIYVIDPSQAASIEAQNEPFDFAVASQIWGMAFSFVVGIFLVSKSAGIILKKIKS